MLMRWIRASFIDIGMSVKMVAVHVKIRPFTSAVHHTPHKGEPRRSCRCRFMGIKIIFYLVLTGGIKIII